MSFVEKFLAKEATSLARSVLQSNAKAGIKSFIQKFKTKSAEQIRAEVTKALGYATCHYTVNKQQEIVYKPSMVFVREWLTNSPFVAKRIIKDEESGHVFVDGVMMGPDTKMDLINEFMKQTGIKVASLNSHFDGALKLLDVTDFTSGVFKDHFAGWDPSNESVINNLLPRLYGEALETDAKYASFLFRKWIIGTAKRAMEPGVAFDGCLVLTGPGGVGKCLAKGTPVLMFDGSIKAIEEIIKNDLIMGVDSFPRTVLGIGNGREQMYKITPIKGDSFTVNSSHILALKLGKSKRSKARYEEISVADYLKQSNTFKRRATLYRAGVDFSDKPIPLDPYFLGLWLGDGDSHAPTITANDKEVVEALKKIALDSNVMLTEHSPKNRCRRYSLVGRIGSGLCASPILNNLRSINVINNKHIPLLYKANSRKKRLALLAGLIDSDGSLTNNCFDYISKIKILAEDVCYLARSLGYAAYITACNKKCQTGAIGIYYRVCISGNIEEVPVKLGRKKPLPRRQIKNVLHTGFSVTNVGEGKYFGFELDGDGLFLLGDFTVTHNTSFFRDLLPAPFNNRTGEVLCNIKNPQKFIEGIIGKTISCFDELSSLEAPKSQETFKQLLSTRFIDVRLPWRRDAQRFNLRNSFAATTNKDKFIKDAALSRRLWTIQLNGKSKIDFDYLNSVKKSLWQEAVYFAQQNESYLLSMKEQELVEENNRKFFM